MITFREVDQSNIKEVLLISLHEHQEGFIESVAQCLEEAEEREEWCPVGIYHENDLIGFAMYGAFSSKRYTWIDRIMIDKRFQGQGFGRQAMQALIDIVCDKYDVNKVYLSLYEDNKVAMKLYKELGFAYINQKDKNGELIFMFTRS
jgi:diamine N-acetyltransferase